MSDEATCIQKNEELEAIMDLSMKLKQENILLYSVRTTYSMVGQVVGIFM